MLVVRYLGETTACVVNEGNDSGTLRLREYPSRELWQVLETGNP